MTEPYIYGGNGDGAKIASAIEIARDFAAAESPLVLGTAVETLLERIRFLEDCLSKQNEEISQTLGKVLGYPWFTDDQKNFPGATEADGVCVGDEVAESLAEQAASRIRHDGSLIESCHLWLDEVDEDHDRTTEGLRLRVERVVKHISALRRNGVHW